MGLFTFHSNECFYLQNFFSRLAIVPMFLVMPYLPNIQLRVNRNGGIYDNGPRHSQLLRERVLDLHHVGLSPQLIATEIKTSRHFVGNVLADYNINNSSIPTRRGTPLPPKMVPDVIEFLEMEKLSKPSITCS